jgi:D-alanyl-D-alanine carboxypeptidase/D-alanyl-D-alanine-endopeptidase (penicillin-binding protein 4)
LTLRFNKITLLALAIILGGALFFSSGEAAKAKKAKSRRSSRRSQAVVYMPKPTGDIQDDLDKLFDQKLPRLGRWGIAVMDLESGDIIYQHNSQSKFIPASNAKLFTTAVALEQLGPNFSYQTEIFALGEIDSSGVLHGDLIIKGSGDPTISELGMLEEWADSLKSQGITEVDGDIIGDEGNFVPEKIVSMVPRATNKLVKSKKRMAWQISGLSYRDNLVAVTISGGQLGKPLRVSTDPPMAVNIKNLSRTIKGSSSTVTRKIKDKSGKLVTKTRKVYYTGKAYASFDGEALKITGKLAQGSSKRFLFVAKDPQGHFARVFAAVLKNKGIEVSGQGLALTDKPLALKQQAELIYANYSPPLSEIIKIINKNSHNLYAEALLNTIGSEMGGEGSRQQGSLSERTITEQMGLGTIDLYDGCGLSRLNTVSPQQVVNLLKFMSNQPYWEAFYNSLAIGGIDGTLTGRLSGPKVSGRIYAKTGSIGGVSALSGYLTAKNGKMFAFSIMVNNIYRAKLARRIEDYICQMLVEYLG